MTERLLQYIWQHRYYRAFNLASIDLQPIEVLSPGEWNQNQGPDFLNARIRIDGNIWVGHVELHVKSTDWELHGHSGDHHYRNIILHVVWQYHPMLPLPFPTLELQNIVPKILLSQYGQLMQSGRFIPCENQVQGIDSKVLSDWKESLLQQRLQQKSWQMEQSLEKNQYHWEESFWHFLARNFGYPVNQDLFLAIAESIPVRWLSKYKKQPEVIEALLLGQAGLLENRFTDPYPIMLQREYRFLQKKHALMPVYWPVHFLRMRPANFPTIRLAQLASLVHRSSHLFSKIRELNDLADARELFRVSTHEYWNDHYMPDKAVKHAVKIVGRQMADNIIINTIIPFLYTYGWLNRQESLIKRALTWMKEMPPEKNRITNKFSSLGLGIRHAADSQAFLFMKKQYCDQHGCLHCAIGKRLVHVEDEQGHKILGIDQTAPQR